MDGIEWPFYIIIFSILKNEMGILFYFYVWFNKIIYVWNRKKDSQYNNILIIKYNKIFI